MKNVLIAVGLVIALIVFLGTRKSDAAVMEEAKSNIVVNCKKSAGNMPNIPADKVDNFCKCAADKMLTQLGPERVREVSKKDTPSEADLEMAKQAGVQCVGELLPQ